MNECKKCGIELGNQRAHLGYTECLKCSEVEAYSAHTVYPHKTGGYVQPVSKEKSKDLKRLDRRSVGNTRTAFISSSNGLIEISSSAFHLDHLGNVTLSGSISASTGNIGGWEIGDSALSSSGMIIDSKNNTIYQADKGPGTDTDNNTDALLALRDLLSETHELIDYVDTVIEQLDDLKIKLNSNSSRDNSDLISLSKKIVDFKDEELMRPPPSMSYRQRPRLRGEIRSLMRAIDNTTNSPTIPQLERIESLAEELNQHKTMMNEMELRINEINESNASLPQIILKGN